MSVYLNRAPRCFIVEVVPPHIHREDAVGNFSEIKSLIKTFGGEVIGTTIQHRVSPHPSTYIGSGKLKKLKKIVALKKIDIVILNSIVNSGQIFRLEKILWEEDSQIAVFDRVDLILHIFDRHARTNEAKLQIELAKISHMGLRIYGLGKTLLSRQAGGIGTRGIGETNIEIMKRHIKKRKRKVKQLLEKIERRKKSARERRRLNGASTVSLVGYTNAGKTTLFNKLTGKRKPVRNSLFTTLDSIVGHLNAASTYKDILISDTIGFISNLPPFLIDAFRSTLAESAEADLVLHVIDASDENFDNRVKVVRKITKSLKIDKQRELLIFNKVDRITDSRRYSIYKKYIDTSTHFISAKTGKGLLDLKKTIVGYILNSYYNPRAARSRTVIS